MIAIGAALFISAASAFAQSAPQPWIDIGSAAVRQPLADTRVSASLGGGLWYQHRRVGLEADASAFLAADSAAAAQLSGQLAFAVSRASRLALDGAWLRARRDNTARMVELEHTLQHALRWGAITWQVHGGSARSARGITDFRGDRLGTAVTLTRGPWHIAASAARAHTDDYLLMEASGLTLSRLAASYALDDVGAEMGWRHQRGALSVVHQWRQGREATVGRTSASAVTGSVSLTPSTRLVLQVGTQLADVLRGVPQAQYVGATIRWIPGRRAPTVAIATNTSTPGTNRGEVAIVREPGRSALLVVVDAPADAVVELASSANGWTPIRLTRQGTVFTQRVDLPTGTHTVAVRINGGAWRAPRGLVVVADDFGGTVGKVTVP